MQFARKSSAEPNRRESAMTPMIDIVFQLLAFFILTFRVAVPEGDFGVTMPAASANPSVEVPLEETMHVHLVADREGKLIDIRVNHRSLGADATALHRYVLQLVGTEGPSNLRRDFDVKLHFDPHLHYEHAMAALSAISAYRDASGNSAVLIERIQFERPSARAKLT